MFICDVIPIPPSSVRNFLCLCKNIFSLFVRNVTCLLITILFSIIAFQSCKQKTNYSKEIIRLDSAETVLAAAAKNLLSLDTSRLRTSYYSAEEKLRLISEKIFKDTVKKRTAMLLSDAYEQTGNIRNLLDNKKQLERAVSEGQQRMKDLKHDLSEDLIEKNKSAAYVVNEMNASQKIYEAVNKTIEKAKSSVIKLDSIKTQILFLADSVQSK